MKGWAALSAAWIVFQLIGTGRNMIRIARQVHGNTIQTSEDVDAFKQHADNMTKIVEALTSSLNAQPVTQTY
jgi:hypothetical protein